MTRFTVDGFNHGYRCDQCGRESMRWTSRWSHYSSIAMEECRPDLIPHLCSDDCREAFSARIKAGEVEVPVVKTKGYNGFVVKGDRRGY